MCSSTGGLILFLLLKIIILIIIPLFILLFKFIDKKIIKMLFRLDIILIILFIILRIFNNGCIVNSTISNIGINIQKNNSVLEIEADNLSENDIEADTTYKTYNNKTLYYFNQNNASIKEKYYVCDGKKYYMNTFGSSINSVAMVVSTLYDKNVNPFEVFNSYKSNYELCNNKITIQNLITSTSKNFGALDVAEINSSEIERGIKNGGLVIVELNANSNSKLTCDTNYIVIYNIGRDGYYLIADPAIQNYNYVCPYSSKAYGNIIKSNNMEKSWSLNDINNEAIHYYLINLGQDGGHD